MRPAPRGDVLADVAALLGRAAVDGSVDAAVGVRLLDDGVELHLRPTPPGGHPVDALLGFDAPPDWAAVGLVGGGRARVLDHAGAAAEPVLVVHLQHRDGACTSLVGPTAGPLQPVTGPAQGRMVDLCRRSLGLPTDPPPSSTLRWWAGAWVDALCGEPALELAREADVVTLFPGWAPSAVRTLDGLVRCGQDLAHRRPWSAMRRAAATGRCCAPGLTPSDAAWLDDGSFARWVLAAAIDLRCGLAELDLRLAPPLASGVRRVLQRWAVGP